MLKNKRFSSKSIEKLDYNISNLKYNNVVSERYGKTTTNK